LPVPRNLVPAKTNSGSVFPYRVDQESQRLSLQQLSRPNGNFTERRDTLAAQIKTVLEGAAFKDIPIYPGTAASLAAQADGLVQEELSA
jgi:hypothetical protein